MKILAVSGIFSVLIVAGCQISPHYLSTDASKTMSSISSSLPSVISSEIRIISNELYVKDLEKMKKWYTQGLAFDVVSSGDNYIVLGYAQSPLLYLYHTPTYALHSGTGAGLYHIAYLHHTKAGLVERLKRILSYDPSSFEGSSDHSVSEAFYFTDPEGNGVELYADRDRSQRQREGNQVVMGSRYIDVTNYLTSFSGGGDKSFRIGHNHLQVGNIEVAKKFYGEIVGFDMVRDESSRGAIFMSAGGYHHHFGLNVRNSNGAGPRPLAQLGLGKMIIAVRYSSDLVRLEQRLSAASIEYQKGINRIEFFDPWNNILSFISME